ncbi:PREDICTED: DNA damage-regulated autophagy modulator protein 2 [Nicrophorus vespilloides]|uniref:DNA damage-regulated autophagy modulator protein 2 n=1 Tax=Nicrophorus vespilloides TaxID=110193 RepID=A0ABM1MFV5_NICVS|nr:PREDICTED: DNA damage-regulated autophagy modulator protein 2 [Nicrophorus vespilloides]
MVYGNLHYFPIVLSIWFLITFITLYIMSVCMKDVEPIFPYISDTGTFVPESCIFGQLLNTGSIIMGIVFYIRYLQVKELHESLGKTAEVSGKNKACLHMGWMASFGVSVVGNFQETNLLIVHLIGAVMAFGLGSAYQITMWRVTVLTDPESRCLRNFRFVLSMLSTIACIVSFSFAVPAAIQFTGKDLTKWKREDGGYTYHLLSTSFEWVCATSTMFFILTFAPDFKKISLEPPKINLL